MPIAPKLQTHCMIIDVRGGHGSGKSWLMHKILSTYTNTPILEKDQHLGYLLPEINGRVMGRYSNVCGGCDGVKTADEVVNRVKMFANSAKVVLMEGILVAHTFQRYSNLAKQLEYSGHKYKFLFLDTPLDVCIERVKARRLASGNKKPLNPSNVIKDHKNIFERVRAKCLAAGHDVTVLHYQAAWEELKGILDNVKS